MKIYALGIDLGKTVFHLVGLDASGQVVVRKRCSRTQLLAFTANLEVQLIGMEACSGAHSAVCRQDSNRSPACSGRLGSQLQTRGAGNLSWLGRGSHKAQ
jgi:hypothetical protein